ncbi:MAG: mannose-1-phosphate guanylyltransferase/mannose-6-phosphate isomerase [Gammaproteobacteria bacterium]|nr:mannose-1-phosphate guanylyltransferase/mannose-6-phosphate isomerase [Gammaproteobacteria bacterium]
MIVPVILCGGSGTRLWPVSRKLYPKQLHALAGTQSLLQQTLSRLAGLPDTAEPIIVCNSEHRFMTAEQLESYSPTNPRIIVEPEGRNTAPAAAICAIMAKQIYGDPVILVLPADHVILDGKAFRNAVVGAMQWAEQGMLITFGVPAKSPETGFGYIKRGNVLGATNSVYKVDQFVEKPDRKQAEKFVGSQEYLWNCGIFLFRASSYLDELDRYCPEIATRCRDAMQSARTELGFIWPDEGAFLSSPSDSIDYAVMEHTDRSAVAPFESGWGDVGSWKGLWSILDHDDDGNVLTGDVMVEDVSDSYIYSQGRLVAAIGLDNHVVVETADAVLVAPKDKDQDVKKIVSRLERLNRPEAEVHKRVYRPWGSYQSVDGGERFQVKRLIINPGAKISLQLHHKRSEHWIVVRGKATVTRGDETFSLSENESTYIPQETVHQLENHGQIPLEIVEVQTGSYLGEDDIVRFEDKYGRV